jgi:hypothetical protein
MWDTELDQIPPVGISLSIILCEKQKSCLCVYCSEKGFLVICLILFKNIILNLQPSLLLHSLFCTPAAAAVALQSSMIICVLLGFRKRLLMSLTDLKYLQIQMLCLKSLEICIHRLKIYSGSNKANAPKLLCSAYISQLAV